MIFKRLFGTVKNENGASAVEFAIVLPVLALLIFGLIEFGVLFFDYLSITHAAREGVRLAAVNRYDQATLKQIVIDRTNLDPLKVSVDIGFPPDPVTNSAGKMGDPVYVKVAYIIVPLTGYIPLKTFLPASLSSTATMRLEQNAF